MAVIGIDPAPGKRSTLFDGSEFKTLTAPELRACLCQARIRSRETVICWDAPLTGPRCPNSAGRQKGDLTQRPIEKFFSRQETSFKTPKGISVRPYGGCPHWTISRLCLGLPRVGPFDRAYAEMPFHLHPGPDDEQNERASVIEVHPGVAAWLWCKEERADKAEMDWRYKENKRVRDEMWEIIEPKAGISATTPESDDEFDALIAYILGVLWSSSRQEKEAPVLTLGDRSTGSFLVPGVKGLVESWEKCREKL